MSEVAARPILSDAEVAELCDGLVAPSAQIRYLQRLGLLVQRKPNGRPLLLRSELERVLGAGRFGQQQAQNAPASQPNRAALMQVIQGGKRGAQAPRR
jgi:hypothetical protein